MRAQKEANWKQCRGVIARLEQPPLGRVIIRTNVLDEKRGSNVMNWFVLSFLYIPEDKSEYLPASIWIILALVFAIIAMRVFFRISKKEEQKAKELEKAYQKSKVEQDQKENHEK